MAIANMPEPKAKRPLAVPRKIVPDTSLTVVIDENRLLPLVFGQYDQNIARIEQRLDVVANAVGNHVTFRGPKEACEKARQVVESLARQVRNGEKVTIAAVDATIEEIGLQGSLFGSESDGSYSGGFEQISTRKRGTVRARNLSQDTYLKALKSHELVFSDGPAGTGKTWLAVGFAVSMLERGTVERLIVTRPAVEAGERLGFLPGDMREKVDPYLRPIFDALHDFMDPRLVERGLVTGMIEVAPLAFMRGRTLTNACILLDEAQNTTTMQMKMFLTRLGEGSRMIVNGDPSQIDLPPGQKSGLVEAVELLSGLEGIGRARFDEKDVVRHDLVARIVRAYESRGKNA
jgi:phosphate starvation-inducible PhoH-like protein